MEPVYLAYFYKPNSAVVDGWRDRLTIACTEDGLALSPRDYDRCLGWTYLGFYELRKEPFNVWDRAQKND